MQKGSLEVQVIRFSVCTSDLKENNAYTVFHFVKHISLNLIIDFSPITNDHFNLESISHTFK